MSDFSKNTTGSDMALVSTAWLYDALKDCTNKGMAILDCTWHMPQAQRNAKEEYKDKHIPGALYFDIDECSDTSSPYAHMLPSTEQFEQYAGNFGITPDTLVVVYDNSPDNGFFSAPRVWWMFRVFGHSSVSVLDGGLEKWCSDGFPTTSGTTDVAKTTYKGSYHANLVKNYEDIVRNLSEKRYQVVDTLPEGFFTGRDPYPIEGLESGHILGAKNLVYSKLINKEKGVLMNKQDLVKVFNESGIDLSQPVVASCGSGVTACCLALAAYRCGKELPVYDGSWMEFYNRSNPEMRVCPKTIEQR